MWAAVCVMGELFARDPIMQGRSEVHQLQQIINLWGSITEETYPRVTDIKWFEKVKFPKDRSGKVTERLKGCVKDQEIDKLLTIDPVKRVEAVDFFTTEPLPCNFKGMVSRFTN